MERKPYSAGAVKFSFWFMEFRKTVQLLSEGKSFADIKKLNEETNIYGAPTKLRAQQIYSTVTARIKTLDESFYPIFLSSDLATQKLFVLTAALLHDTLFFDFVYEVVREKMIDVSTPEMRSQIIASIEERISAYTEEIEKCDFEISSMQQRIEEIMQDEDITIENIVAYKNGFSSIAEIEDKVQKLDEAIDDIKQKVKAGKKQTEDSKKAQQCAAHARTDQQQAGFQNSGKRFVRDRRETV